MNVVAGVLSYNRMALWEQTVSSLERTTAPAGCRFRLVLYDNGSTERGLQQAVRERHGEVNATPNHTIGHGFRTLMGLALMHDPDVVLLSGNDYEYRPGWLEKLVKFWKAAPAEVAICTLSVEPEYHWTPILARHEIGGQAVLQRRTVPGSNWSFRPALWAEIEQLVPDNSHKYDHRVCTYLREAGRWLCALDLAEHIGEGQRSWK